MSVRHGISTLRLHLRLSVRKAFCGIETGTKLIGLSSSSSSSGSRYFSSRRSGAKGRGFQLDALPFTVAPSEAYAKFDQWAKDEQGLGPLLSIGTTKITAAYTPFWYFDLNIRFVAPRRGESVVPEPFRSAFPNPPNGVIHMPGLAAYAGFSYRRSLIDPVHNTTPVFLRKDIVPFGQWMLEPLKLDNQESLEIYPDPWNATRERAFSVIHDELHDMANEQYDEQTQQSNDAIEVRVETERLSSRRIYMPTYIVEYTILGITYRAFLSGCDPSIQVCGVSHTTIFSAGSKGDQVFKGASSFLSSLPHRVVPTAASALQFFGLRPFVAVARVGWAVVSRIAMKFHLIGLFGGAFVAWRKIFRPYMDDRTATAEWERQRDHEAQTSSESFHEDSFRDNGLAKRYFARNQKRILKSLSGEEGRHEEQEGYEWYSQWEQWAREQWEQAQREASRAQEEWQHQQQGQRQQQQYQQSTGRQQQQRTYKQEKKDDDFKWDFDANDPWSVLGIPRNSSKEEVSKAFRREMLKHHPDLQSQASEKEKRRATERSKIISEAYRKIKTSSKR